MTRPSKSVTNIAEECEKGEGSKCITSAETDVDENTSCKDIQVPQTVTYRKSTKGAKYIPLKKQVQKHNFIFVFNNLKMIVKCRNSYRYLYFLGKKELSDLSKQLSLEQKPKVK